MKKETNAEILARLKAKVAEIKKEEEIFWSQTYPNLSREDKIKYWASNLFRSMRTQEESGYDPYLIYSEKWLKEVFKTEPNFIELLPGIFNIWSGTWKTNRIEKKIKEFKSKLDNTNS